MSILTFIVFILCFTISLGILFQEDNIKNSSLSFIKTSFFSSNLEKIIFLLIISQFFILLLQKKLELF